MCIRDRNGADDIDDTQQFDEAVAYIAEKGGTLTIPAGRYILDNNNRKRIGVNGASYIFLAKNSFTIKMHPNAVLLYKNGFKGFRFRTIKDPNINSPKNYCIEITGGQIDGKDNWLPGKKNNPEIWAFVGEFLENFEVHNLKVNNMYGTAAIAAYHCKSVKVTGCNIINFTGNPEDLVDNHGDGIYTAHCNSYYIYNNQIDNTITPLQRIGRGGICVEYENSGNGKIDSNKVTGYDRAIHIELIKGSAEIRNNTLVDNSTGVALWNNYGFPQFIENNTIGYKNLTRNNVPLLYISAPILMLGAYTNNGTQIINNRIYISDTSFVPNNLLQVTSSDVVISKNKIVDATKTLNLAIAQGKNAKERVRNISFLQNTVSAGGASVYDSSNVIIENNNFDLKEFTASFDNSLNRYRANNFNNSAKTKINLFGKYK